MPYVVDRIVQQGVEANKGRVFVPTGAHFPTIASFHSILTESVAGFQSKQLIVNAGLGLGDVDEYPSIDVTIDGADE